MWWDKESFDPSGELDIKRIWHSHEKWEEIPAGMWNIITGNTRKIMLENAIDFTGDHDLYGKHMFLVVENWKFSCEHNLTNYCSNRKAWIGHAACCFALGIPEDVTREAWGKLSSHQQKMANIQAQLAIKKWEQGYAKNTIGNKCPGSCEGKNFSSVRPVQQNLFEFFRGERQHCNVAPSHG